MFTNKRYVTAVDISSSKICAAVSELDNKGGVRILAADKIDTLGLKKAIVVDMGMTAQILKRLIKDLKETSGISNQSLYLNVSGTHLDTCYCHGAVMISNSKNVIAQRDIKSVIASAHTHGVTLDRTPIHSLLCGYIVDEHDGVINPLEMHAKKLEVDILVITGISNYIKNLIKSVNQAGYQVKELVASGLATSFSVLTEDEKKSGVILIDIGAGVTDITFFKDDKLNSLKIISKGGNDITENISRKLKVSISYAEEIKKRYGCAFVDNKQEDEDIVLKDSNGNIKSIKREEISELIKFSLSEIFLAIKQKLKEVDCMEHVSCGVVITGGVALLDGMIEMAQGTFGLPVRLGLPRNFKSSIKINTPIWSNCLGLTRYALLKENKSSQSLRKSNPLSFIKKKVEDLLRDYF